MGELDGEAEHRCPACLLLARLCLCADLPRVDARTEVIILRHIAEAHRSSNTARLAARALPRARIIDVGAQPPDPRLAQPENWTGAWLLFPEGEPRRVAPVPPPRTLVVLDGNWNQARRMRRRVAAVRGLPVLRLPPPPPRARLRQPPAGHAMSTLEAIAFALGFLEGPAVQEPLLALYDLVVARSAAAGRRGPG